MITKEPSPCIHGDNKRTVPLLSQYPQPKYITSIRFAKTEPAPPRKLTVSSPSAYNGSMFVSALTRYTDLLYAGLFTGCRNCICMSHIVPGCRNFFILCLFNEQFILERASICCCSLFSAGWFLSNLRNTSCCFSQNM